MRAYRGEPVIFADRAPEDRKAELVVEHLTLRFGGITAVGNVSMIVRTGELVSVIGPNGAGKTSLLNCITGYYKAQEGRIHFNGKDISNLPTHRHIEHGIGRTFQNIELFPGMTVLANLLLARHLYCRYGLAAASLFSGRAKGEEIRQRRIIEEIIDFLEIQSIRKKLVGSLPYGMRKRVELGRALALQPKLLVLDEPFAGMNLEEKEDMVRFLLELSESWGQTMILVEHDMSIVMSISSRIMVLNFGEKLAEGTPGEIQGNPDVVRAYLGDRSEEPVGADGAGGGR
jgi:branched-chain amino acid transport system ATP-binding protein